MFQPLPSLSRQELALLQVPAFGIAGSGLRAPVR
jgi:hypothetical protein